MFPHCNSTLAVANSFPSRAAPPGFRLPAHPVLLGHTQLMPGGGSEGNASSWCLHLDVCTSVFPPAEQQDPELSALSLLNVFII